MRRTVTMTALAVLAVVVALSLFLATRHPITNATLTESPLLGKPAPALSGTSLGVAPSACAANAARSSS